MGNNKSLAYIIIIISLFSIIFFARPEYSKISENLEIKNTLASEQSNLSSENEKLKKLEQELKNEDSNKSKQIEKYMVDYKEDELIKYFYDYAEQNKLKISINSLSMGETTINELGFKESTINISLIIANEDAMIKFLGFIINPNSKYKFFINSLSYPIEQANNSFTLNLPIKVFHK